MFLALFCFLFSICSLWAENQIILCEHGLETLKWNLEFIKHAEQTIDFSPCFFGGKILQDCLNAIEERIELYPSLQVHIIACPVLMTKEDKDKIAQFQKKYPEQFHFQLSTNVMTYLPDYSTIDNHVKCLVVDEKYFSLGGTNFDEALCCDGSYTRERGTRTGVAAESLPAGARDQDLVGKGPLAKEIRTLFHKLYAVWEDYNKKNHTHFVKDIEAFQENHYTPIQPTLNIPSFEQSNKKITLDDDEIKIFFSSPAKRPNVITEEYKRLVSSAKDSITIANLYFNPEKSLLHTFLDASDRGIKITLITNGLNDRSPEYDLYFGWSNRINFAPLYLGKTFHFYEAKKAKKLPINNVDIFEYYVNDILYHKKVMIIDNQYTIIGSYNLGRKSDLSDYEITAVINSKQFALQLLQILEKDKALSLKVDPKEAIHWYFDPILSYIASTQNQFHGYL